MLEPEVPEEVWLLAWDPFQLCSLGVQFTPALEINLCLPAQGKSNFSAKSPQPVVIRKIGLKAKEKL